MEDYSLPKRRSSVGIIVAIALAALALGAAGTGGYFGWKSARTAAVVPISPTGAEPSAVTTKAMEPAASPSSTPPAASSASPTAPAPAPASASAEVPAASASALPPDTGRVRTAGAVPGRRIFVDERVLGQTPETVVAKCGVRTIRLGKAGSPQSIDVPCGSEITVGDR